MTVGELKMALEKVDESVPIHVYRYAHSDDGLVSKIQVDEDSVLLVAGPTV